MNILTRVRLLGIIFLIIVSGKQVSAMQQESSEPSPQAQESEQATSIPEESVGWGLLSAFRNISFSSASQKPVKHWILKKKGSEESNFGTADELNNLLNKGKYGSFAREIRYYFDSPGGDVKKNDDLTYACRYCKYESKKIGNPYILFELIKRNSSVLDIGYDDCHEFVKENLIYIVTFVFILASKGCIYQRSKSDEHKKYAKKICTLLKVFLASYKPYWLHRAEEHAISFGEVCDQVRKFPAIANLISAENPPSFAYGLALDRDFNDVALGFELRNREADIELVDLFPGAQENLSKTLEKELGEEEREALFPMVKATELIKKRCSSWEEFFKFSCENIDLL